MTQRTTTLLFALSLAAVLSACTTAPASPAMPAVGLANPASLHCLQRGGQLLPRQDQTGNEYAMCRLPDGQLLEEWALFRQDKNH
ncbi:putative hemolysin [Aquitalea magnusonii]|uniref:Putative hemolysin n=1 Tax=Aquitalea magnusonii TaxID=332411 RepID=A0A3G9GJE4_9NEIS|nr:DUF333 domain-containing protein [Aquitalea magnusonii]BBF85516.1 putative hemolysin [Aquitalea magnusonii]